MALARVKTWVAGEILTAADLNGEFNNILSNPIALISPFLANVNANNKQITNLALELLGTSPSAGVNGRIFFNTANKLIGWDNGANIAYAIATTAFPGPATPTNLVISRPGGASTSKVSVIADRVFIGPQQVDNYSVTIQSSVNGVNGLDAGGLASTSLYYIWGIWNTITSSAGGLMSLSETTPTLPASSGYSTGYQKLLGAVPTSTAIGLYPGKQVGERVFFETPLVISTNLTSTAVAQLDLTGQIPASAVRGVWLNPFVGNVNIFNAHYTSSFTANSGDSTAPGALLRVGTSASSVITVAPLYLPTYNATRTSLFYSNENTNANRLYLDGFEMEFRV